MTTLDLADAMRLPDLPKHLRRVEKNLAHTMRSDARILSEPLTRLRSVRGKRIRPSLVIAAASSTGGVNNATIAAATAIELLHIASLVHDDIIDQSPIRWDQATIVQKEGIEAAIMAGDFLLARAFEQAAIAGQEVAKCLSGSFTMLCNGQALEMQTEYQLNRTTQQYFQAIQGKTAALFAASGLLGALSAKPSQPELEALQKFGQYFGIGFQIVDDLIDLSANSSGAGKTAGNDLPAGNYTLPVLLALQSTSGKELHQLIKSRDFTAASALVYASGAGEDALAEATRHFKKAKKALLTTNYPAFERFAIFVDVFCEWAVNTHLKVVKSPH